MGRLYSCLQTVQLKIEKDLLPWKPIMYFAYFVSTSCRIARWWSWRHQPLQLMRSLVLVGSGCRALQVREGRGVIEMPVFRAFLGRESNAKEPLKFEVDKIVFFVLWSSMILRLRQCNFFQDVLQTCWYRFQDFQWILFRSFYFIMKISCVDDMYR